MSYTLVKAESSKNPNIPPHVALVELVQDDLVRVNTVIDQLGNSHVSLINDITSQLIHSGGKRLRPLLTLVSAKICQYEGEGHINLAAAVEFMHTATLLHDDVVDESKMRRGVATANETWDNKSSVLVGDFLLGHAFRLMVTSNSVEVLRILSDASAIIAEGEVKQLVSTNDLYTQTDRYIDIISSKTATLFSAACEIIPVLANRPENEIKALRDFGMYLGIAFQIADDILDYSAKEEKLGKTIGDDFREGKVTLPVIYAYAKATDEEQLFWQRVINQLDQQEGDLEHALGLLIKHNAIDWSIDAASHYIDKAKDTLSLFAESKAKTTLLDLLDFSLNRLY